MHSMMNKNFHMPDLGTFAADCGFRSLNQTEDGRFIAGKNDVVAASPYEQARFPLI